MSPAALAEGACHDPYPAAQIHSGEHAAGVPGPPYGLWGLYGKQCSTPEGPEPAGHACRPDVGRGRQSPPAGDRFSPGWVPPPLQRPGRSALPAPGVHRHSGGRRGHRYQRRRPSGCLSGSGPTGRPGRSGGRPPGWHRLLPPLSPGGCGGRRGPLGLCRPDLGAGKSSGPAADVPAGGAAGAGLFLCHLPAPLHPGLTPRRAVLAAAEAVRSRRLPRVEDPPHCHPGQRRYPPGPLRRHG